MNIGSREVFGEIAGQQYVKLAYFTTSKSVGQLSLLSWYVNGAEQARPTWMDFYGCKLYTYDASGNETLARDYVPCIKDGIVCLYDEVSKTFFYNAGQGELIPGERT